MQRLASGSGKILDFLGARRDMHEGSLASWVLLALSLSIGLKRRKSGGEV